MDKMTALFGGFTIFLNDCYYYEGIRGGLMTILEKYKNVDILVLGQVH